ncbi:Protein cbp-1, partial [Bienertia sinuspersici]
QETPKYKNLIRQHIDLETIQKRLEEGQYTDCQIKFYRDVMLLINNAIIFFTKKSPEHKAALELRQLLNKQFQTHVSSPHDQKSRPSKSAQPVPLQKSIKQEPNQPDLKQPKLTITGPVIACKKRSSIAGKSSRGGEERKELPLVSPSSEKLSSLGLKIKQHGEKTSSTSFNAVTKKRTRDQSFGSRSSSSKSNRNQSPSTPILGKGESSEAKADKKKPSPGNSSSKVRHGSSKGKGTLLLESLKNSDKQKTGNDGNVVNVKSDRRKDEGPQNGSGSKLSKERAKVKEERISTLSKEKAKVKEERESMGNRSNRRPPKRAAAIAAMGKRGRDGGGESEKKRQRK